MSTNDQRGKFISSVKVGPKGQIVIPKEVRDMFGIAPGDTLILLSDIDRGIAIERQSVLNKIADAIFAGKSGAMYPGQAEEEYMAFAKTIKTVTEDGKNE